MGCYGGNDSIRKALVLIHNGNGSVIGNSRIASQSLGKGSSIGILPLLLVHTLNPLILFFLSYHTSSANKSINIPMASQSRIFWRLALIVQVDKDDHFPVVFLVEIEIDEMESKRGDSKGRPIRFEAAMQQSVK